MNMIKAYACENIILHYIDIMGTMASQIASLIIVYSTVYSGADQRKHQSSASRAICSPVPHKWSVTRKMFPFDDVIMDCWNSNKIHAIGYQKWNQQGFE